MEKINFLEVITSYISLEHKSHRPLKDKIKGAKSFDEAKDILVNAGFIFPKSLWAEIVKGEAREFVAVDAPRKTVKITSSDEMLDKAVIKR